MKIRLYSDYDGDWECLEIDGTEVYSNHSIRSKDIVNYLASYIDIQHIEGRYCCGCGSWLTGDDHELMNCKCL